MRANRKTPRSGSPATWREVEQQQIARRLAESTAQPGGKTSGGERFDLYDPKGERALKVAAWDEARAAQDCSIGLGEVSRALDYPPPHFVAVELGFALAERPSLAETRQGLRSREECEARVRVAQAGSVRRKLTGKQAQRALRAKTRAAMAEESRVR
jgi:hypothetical protein